MNILGISAYYHDSAAALLCDGVVVAAAQEERFSRRKQDASFPSRAVDFCLKQAGLAVSELDYVVFYEKPLQKFDRLLETYLAFAPRGFASFSRAIPQWLKQKLFLRRDIRHRLGRDFRGKLLFTEHHQSHAASAFYPSPFERAAVLTVDGVGEWATASIGVGNGRRLELYEQMNFPHSLGLLYSAFTGYCGFRVNSGEYKLMGLAPYGRPVYAGLIREKLVRIFDDGSIQLNLKYFNYCTGLTMTSPAFDRLFGGPARRPESPLTGREMDLAASIQSVTEEIILKMARHVRRLTGEENLCLAGGVALNCSANGRLAREKIFERIWIQPASGDAGGALGAAWFVWHQLLGRERVTTGGDRQQGSLLGPAYSAAEIGALLKRRQMVYEEFDSEPALLAACAALLREEKVVGWFQGRMELGPRALGCRRILGDPRSEKMQAQMNLKIKFRESFRPFAPSVLAERAAEYFDFAGESPYMLMVAPLAANHRRKLTAAEEAVMGDDPDLNRRLQIRRSDLPAVTHIDYSARLQTVDETRHGRYRRLLEAFAGLTGCPVLINTSFNIRGEPIVNTPEEALHCFLNTDMDVLVLENFLLRKERQQVRADSVAYRREFRLD